MFSVNTMEEAEDLVVLTCPSSRISGEYFVPELAEVMRGKLKAAPVMKRITQRINEKLKKRNAKK